MSVRRPDDVELIPTKVGRHLCVAWHLRVKDTGDGISSIEHPLLPVLRIGRIKVDWLKSVFPRDFLLNPSTLRVMKKAGRESLGSAKIVGFSIHATKR